MLVSQLLKIGRGAIIELDQSTSDPVEIRVNQQLIAYGEIVTAEGNSITLRVPKSKTADVTGRLLADLPVIDLTIEDPPIEEVIEQVFST